MKFHLEKAAEHLEAASQARSERDYPACRLHYLKSAQFLFKAAAKSSGRMREIRARKAEELLELAGKVEGRSRLVRGDSPVIAAVEEGDSNFLLRDPVEVRFDDVVGLDQAKEEIKLRLIYPLQHPEKAARYGIKPGGGMLLFGPPGTGKTLLARAVAGEVGAPFFTAKPSELMSRWVGQAEQNVARLFEVARSCERAVIFLDEVEALLPARRSASSTVMRRVVPQILAEMQGVRDTQGTLLFLGATNEPWALDRAVLRPGRFHAKIYVGLPEALARRAMLALYLADRPLGPDVNLDSLAQKLAGYSGADIAELCDRCAARVFVESINEGVARDISAADIEAALDKVRPSVSPVDVERYARWADRSGRGNKHGATGR